MRRTPVVLLALALSGCTSHLAGTHAEEPVTRRADGSPQPLRPSGARPVPLALHDEVPTEEETREETELDVTATLPTADPTALGGLGDPGLRALVLEALDRNRNVVAATARVFEAWALADIARSRLMPEVFGRGAANYNQSITPGIGAVTSRSFQASIPVGYEVDIFGRFYQENRATRDEAEASEEERAAIGIGVAAEVAEAWLDLVYVKVQRTQLERQLETNERLLSLLESRFSAGITNEVDVLQQRQQVAAVRTNLASLEGTERVATARLAVLLGRSPIGYTVDVPATFPELPQLPEDGLTADVVEQRPDIRAALLRLRAADRRYLVAARQMLPVLKIAVTPGWQTLYAESSRGQGTTSGFVFSAVATLDVPLFQGLRNVALRGQRRAQVDELVAGYEQTMISALSEVESAMALEAQKRALLITLEDQRRNAAELRESSEAQYEAGIVDFLTIFLAVRSEQTAELALVAMSRELYSARVQLLRALGGGVHISSPAIR
ncbi:MAG: TolC family protein [Polyangiales bacterium]